MTNPLNYITLPIAQKLVENGIVCREIQPGDRVYHMSGEYGLVAYLDPLPVVYKDDGKAFRCDPRTLTILYGAAELWRELPFQAYTKKMDDGRTLAWICDDSDSLHTVESDFVINTNLTDALAELLIWVKGKGKG